MVAVTAKVPPPLRDRIDAAAEEGEPRSACLRRLIRAGLESETGGGLSARFTLGFGLALLVATGAVLAASGQLRIAIYLAVAIAVGVTAEPWIIEARDLLLDKFNR